VRHAASLFGVCRRVRDVLRAEPLPLALDFSAAPLSEDQRAWLAAPVRVGRIESAAFFTPRSEASGEEERLWRGGHEAFLARHGRALLRLSGVPLRLVATFDPSAPPALDLSGLRLTALGLDCTVRRADRRRELWLAPGFLPHRLVELELRGVGTVGQALLFDMAWAAHPALRPDARPPALQRVSVSGRSRMRLDGLALLQGLAAAPALSVDSGRSHLAVHARVLERVRSLHLRGAPVCLDCPARALPAGDTRVTFGGAGMQRQARRPPAAPRAGSLPCRARAGACRASPGEAGCAGRRCHAACLACARRERAGPHGRTARSARAAGRVAVGRQ